MKFVRAAVQALIGVGMIFVLACVAAAAFIYPIYLWERW